MHKAPVSDQRLLLTLGKRNARHSVRRRIRVAAPIALAGIAAASLTACGSSAGSSTSAAGTSAATAHFSGSYDLLQLAPLSSGLAAVGTYPEIATGAQAAAAQINAAGGVNGREIKIITCDTKGITNDALSCAHEAASDKVLAVVGSNESTGQYLSILQSAGIPDVGAIAVQKEVISPDAWTITSPIPLLDGAAELLAKEGITDIANPFPDLTGYNQFTSEILAPVEKALHVKITNIPVEAGETDYAPVVAAAEQHQGIMLTLAATQLVPFMQAYAQSGSKVPVVAVTIDNQTISTLGPTANGIQLPLQMLPASLTTNPAVEKYDQAMNAIDPKAAKDYESETAYLAVELVADEIRGMSSVTPANLASKLNATTGVNLGLLPSVQFTKPSTLYTLFPRIFNLSVIAAKVENGTVVAADTTFRNAITGATVAQLPS